MPLFHRQVSWPQRVKQVLPRGKIVITYSKHASQELLIDRYGPIGGLAPQVIDMSRVITFECGLNDDNTLNKFAVRFQLDKERDLILVITSDLVVKTAWINLRSDKHATLRVSQYDR